MQINGNTGEKTTYKELLQRTVDVGNGLKRLGVKRGDVVALCGENKPEYLIAAIAAVCCGATITTLNLMYTKGSCTVSSMLLGTKASECRRH